MSLPKPFKHFRLKSVELSKATPRAVFNFIYRNYGLPLLIVTNKDESNPSQSQI